MTIPFFFTFEDLSWWEVHLVMGILFPFKEKDEPPKTINMNIFTACEVFFTFLEAQPCHVR